MQGAGCTLVRVPSALVCSCYYLLLLFLEHLRIAGLLLYQSGARLVYLLALLQQPWRLAAVLLPAAAAATAGA